jgi:hypothetical protein
MTVDSAATASKLEELHSDVALLKTQMLRNTEITEQIRDVLTSFRVVASVAKWGAAIVAGAAALWHGIDLLPHK